MSILHDPRNLTALIVAIVAVMIIAFRFAKDDL